MHKLSGRTLRIPDSTPVATPVATIIPAKPALLEIPAKLVPPTVPVPEKPKAPVRKPPGLYSVQLGSLASYRDAERELKTLKQRHGDILSGLNLRVVSGTVTGKGRVWRIRATGLSSLKSAERTCRSLGAKINSCLVLRPR
jgi:cell division septation protein DedD